MAVTPIVALDFPSARAALDFVDVLGDDCGFYKVGSELFTAEGPSIVNILRERRKEVFLDLKFHDIPNTVSRAVRAAGALGVRLLTVHASGGSAMLRAAAEAANAAPRKCEVLAVTVLTSLDAESLGVAAGRPDVRVEAEVERLATVARAAGVHGIVCSGHEAAAIRAQHGSALKILVPGIRLAGDSADDQARVFTPRDAARAGADYIVLGRAVTKADDARGAMRRVLEEIAVKQ
jgi:orotidine-5'-phosphate decarboxylase